MKKARRPPVEAHPAYLLPGVGDDARARLKLESLMQDYEELLKDMSAKKRRLQMGRQKLLRLTDEVRFLRRRYKYLTKHASPAPCNVKTQRQKAVNALKHKARKSPATLNTRPQSQMQPSQHDRSHREKEVAAPSTSAILDLNQILLPNGEEDFQLAWEPLPMERSSTMYASEGDVPGGDIKLSVCRDVQSGSGRPGKRKISWQDQVALKV